MNNKYYYAKIGAGNKWASQDLSGDNEIGRPAIPIFYSCTFDDNVFLKNAEEERGTKRQIETFLEVGKNNADRYIIVSHEGHIYFLEPAGSIEKRRAKNRAGHSSNSEHKCDECYIRLLPVKKRMQKKIAEVPPVLASINANTYISRGTFREIPSNTGKTYDGNIIAIQAMLGHDIPKLKDPSFGVVLQCLSSVELETLIAKIFEEAECFVPAYRGGNMKDVDLFAHNRTGKKIDIAGLAINPDRPLSIQVKLSSDASRPPEGVDVLIASELENNEGCFDSDWIIKALKQSEKTRAWLKESLHWIPDKYRNDLTRTFDS